MEKFYLLFNKYFYFVILALLAFIPLYPKFPLFNVPRTYVAIRIEDVLIFLIVCLWVLGTKNILQVLSRDRIIQFFILFWLIGGLGVFSGIFITHTVDAHLGILHWVRRIEYMSLFIIASQMIFTKKKIKGIVLTMLVTALVVILYGFGQIYLNFPVISTTNKEFSKGLILYLNSGARVNSTFAGHYDLAMYLSIILVMLASFFFHFKKFHQKLLVALLGLVAFGLLGLTAARVSFVTTILGLSVVFWLQQKKILILLTFFVALGLVVAIPELRHRLVATITVNLLEGGGPKYDPPKGTVTAYTPQKLLPEHMKGKIIESTAATQTIPADTARGEPTNSTELGVYRSYGIRLDVEWPRAINAFKTNPLLGTGYSSTGLATDNDYLRSLAETGLLGTISFGLILFFIARKMIRYIKLKQEKYRALVFALYSVLITLLLTATFIDVFEASKIAEMLWLLLGIGWSVMSENADEEKNETT